MAQKFTSQIDPLFYLKSQVTQGENVTYTVVSLKSLGNNKNHTNI